MRHVFIAALLLAPIIACASSSHLQKAPYVYIDPFLGACADKYDLDSGVKYKDVLAVLWAQDGEYRPATLTVGESSVDFEKEALGFIWRGKLAAGKWRLAFRYQGREFVRSVYIYNCK